MYHIVRFRHSIVISYSCSSEGLTLLELGSRGHVQNPIKLATAWSHHPGRQIFRLDGRLCSQQLLHHLRFGFPNCSEDTALGRVEDLRERKRSCKSSSMRGEFLLTGRVRVTLAGGGLGESVM